MRTLPATHAALAAGSITYRHTQAMVTHAEVLPREARAGFEQKMLPVASSTTRARFEKTARRERELAHPESIETRTASAFSKRSVRVEDDCDGMSWITALVPA